MKPTGTSTKPPRLPWDKPAVIAALHARRDKGLGTNIGAIQKSEPGLASAIYRLFHGHGQALVAAGMDPPRVRWDKPAVVAALHARRDKGLGMDTAAIQKSESGLATAIYRLFGRHSQALLAAGMDPARKRRADGWDKPLVIAALHARRDKGLGTDTGAIRKSEPGLATAIYRLFGRHRQALLAAGMDPTRKRRAGSWDESMVVSLLRRRHAAGEPLSQTLLRQQHSQLFSASVRLFKSYPQALRAAGIDPAQVRARALSAWPTERILDGIREYYACFWANHPRTYRPRPRLTGADPKLVSAARSRFGSVAAAVKAAGIDDPIQPPCPLWPPDQILAALRKASTDGTISPHSTGVADLRLGDAVKWHFGSLRYAAEAAGLRYIHEA